MQQSQAQGYRASRLPGWRVGPIPTDVTYHACVTSILLLDETPSYGAAAGLSAAELSAHTLLLDQSASHTFRPHSLAVEVHSLRHHTRPQAAGLPLSSKQE